MRFYFHFKNGENLETDDEGADLPHLSAAVREAELGAREILADAIRAGKSDVPEALVIADENGRELFSLPLAAVLPEPLAR